LPLYLLNLHCKKRFAVFPSPARMSLTKLSLAGNNLPNPSPWKVWSKQIQESHQFLLQCTLPTPHYSYTHAIAYTPPSPSATYTPIPHSPNSTAHTRPSLAHSYLYPSHTPLYPNLLTPIPPFSTLPPPNYPISTIPCPTPTNQTPPLRCSSFPTPTNPYSSLPNSSFRNSFYPYC